MTKTDKRQLQRQRQPQRQRQSERHRQIQIIGIKEPGHVFLTIIDDHQRKLQRQIKDKDKDKDKDNDKDKDKDNGKAKTQTNPDNWYQGIRPCLPHNRR